MRFLRGWKTYGIGALCVGLYVGSVALPEPWAASSRAALDELLPLLGGLGIIFLRAGVKSDAVK